jgi:ferritin-like metal-binding protein YciE
MPETLEEQLTKHLTDAHSIEVQALLQMRVAPRMARDPQLARAFREHIVETEEQERLVRERLAARGADPSRLKDIAGRAGGVGMVLFARTQPDTPGKLVAHAYSYEHMELAAYELLSIVAERAGDSETAAVARSIGEQEAAMAERLAAGFDRAVEASLREVTADDVGRQLGNYLADAFAIESQALQLLEQGREIAGESELSKVFSDHLEETRSQQAAVRARIEARDERPSRFKSVLLRIGGVNLGAFSALSRIRRRSWPASRSPSSISRSRRTSSSYAWPDAPVTTRPLGSRSASSARSGQPQRRFGHDSKPPSTRRSEPRGCPPERPAPERRVRARPHGRGHYR